MKRAIAGLIAGLVLGTAGVGAAASNGYWQHKTDGVCCKNSGGTIACVPMSGEGYGIGISRDAVMVMRASDSKTMFVRMQP
jgi:hypothetical protein